MLDSYKTKINYPLITICFTLYLFLLIWVIVFKCADPDLILSPNYTLNPISFGPSAAYLESLDLKGRFLNQFLIENYTGPSIGTVIKDLFINIVMFFPLGTLLCVVLKKHRVLICTATGFTISSIFELFQLFTGFGGFQFYDIVLNTLGTLLGVLIYYFLIKIIKTERVNFAINISSTITTIIFIPCVIMAIMSYVKYIDVINYRLYYLM